MKTSIRNLKDVTESKEFLENQPHPFVTLFVYIILFIVVGTIVWASIFEIDVKVKANGIVRPDDKLSSIRSKIDGRISYIHIENGMKVKKGQLLMSIAKDAMNVEKSNILRELSNYNFRINNLITLEELILAQKDTAEGKGRFNRNAQEYYLQFQDYNNNIERYTTQIKKFRENYEIMVKLYEKGGVAKDDLKEAKNQLDSLELEMKIYKNKVLMDIKNSIKQFSDLKDTLQNRLETVSIYINDADVVAPMSGTINLVNELNRGDLLQSGVELATIVPDDKDKSQFKVYLSIKNKDIAELQIGQKVKYHFLAIPYKEYGTLTGTLVNIGLDSKSDLLSESGAYFAEATIENRPLYGYKGDKKEIKVGMVCEAQLIVKTKKILHYFLETIKLMDD